MTQIERRAVIESGAPTAILDQVRMISLISFTDADKDLHRISSRRGLVWLPLQAPQVEM